MLVCLYSFFEPDNIPIRKTRILLTHFTDLKKEYKALICGWALEPGLCVCWGHMRSFYAIASVPCRDPLAAEVSSDHFLSQRGAEPAASHQSCLE